MKASPSPKLGRPIDLRLRERRREQILDAAVKLFAEDGYTDADTQVLAANLKIGKGTIYRYFPSKRELFLAAADRAMQQLQVVVNQATSAVEEPLERIAVAIQAYLDFFDNRPEYVELLMLERAQFKDRVQPTYFEHQEKNIGKWQGLFESLVAAGRVRDLPSEKITRVMSDLVYGTMFTNYFTRRRRSLGEQAKEILDVVFNGILSETERKQSERKQSEIRR